MVVGVAVAAVDEVLRVVLGQVVGEETLLPDRVAEAAVALEEVPQEAVDVGEVLGVGAEVAGVGAPLVEDDQTLVEDLVQC